LEKEKEDMSRHLAWFFWVIAMLALSAPLQALTYEVGGCKTGAGYVNFTTISAAVIGVPAGSTIEVCPGVYSEQVTITQPLTLKGIAFNNASRAVITINDPTGAPLAPNVTSLTTGQPFYAQVLVQNVNPAGPVNLTGITVDGSGGSTGECSIVSAGLAGIFYAPGTSGTVDEVTARNQVNDGCGFGVWVENADATSETITIKNSSVHDVGGLGVAIAALSLTPSTLTSTISGNFLSNAGFIGIEGDASGTIAGNVLTSSGTGETGIFAEAAGLTVSANTAASWYEGIRISLASTVESNKLSNVGTAITFFPDAVVPVKSNTAMNVGCGFDFLSGSITGAISGNVLNDAANAFANWLGSSISGNSLYNVDTIQPTVASCP